MRNLLLALLDLAVVTAKLCGSGGCAIGGGGESPAQAATDRPAPWSQAGAEPDIDRPAAMRILVAYRQLPNGGYDVASFWGLLLNRWALLQHAHNTGGALVIGSFAMAPTSAYYLPRARFVNTRGSFSASA